MLSITCKCGEAVLIYPSEKIDPNMTVGELFADGPMVVQIYDTKRGSTRVAIEAPEALTILRDKLDAFPDHLSCDGQAV